MAARGACSPALAAPRFKTAPQLVSSFLPRVHGPSPVAGPARARVRPCASLPRRDRGVVLPPFQDKFGAFLAEAAASEEGREQLFEASKGLRDDPPLLDIAARRAAEAQSLAAERLAEEQWRARGQHGPAAGTGGGRSHRSGVLMAAPAQVERGGSGSGYGEHRPRRPPPDLPSLLLHSRIVYIGMPVSHMLPLYLVSPVHGPACVISRTSCLLSMGLPVQSLGTLPLSQAVPQACAVLGGNGTGTRARGAALPLFDKRLGGCPLPLRPV